MNQSTVDNTDAGRQIAQWQQEIDAALRDLLFEGRPDSLYNPLRYALEGGGKRLRPLLVMLGGRLFGHTGKNLLPIAAAVEIFHNFTLVHDDVMDNAAIRRNRPTVFARNGANAAILAGDAMMINAYDCLGRAEARHLPELLSLFNRTAREVCEGQQLDIDFEAMPAVAESQYLRMIGLKTAVLLAAALRMGAIAADAPVAQAQALYDFGYHMGVAFQIQDDWLDTFGTEAALGKRIGGDIIANKKTLLFIAALRSAITYDREALTQWYSVHPTGEKDEALKIQEVTALFSRYGVDKYALRLRDEYVEKANACLAQLNLDEGGRVLLAELTQKLIHRNR